MRIAIEALGIHYYGGGRSATLRLLEALFTYDAENEYLIFLSQPEPSLVTEAGNVRQYIAPVKNRFGLRLWAQARLPWLTRDYDLVHFIKNLGVFGIQTRMVVTMYDMTTLLYPQYFPALDVWYWRNLQGYTLRRADRIIAISHNTARDILCHYGIPAGHIEVIYPAHSSHFRPASPDEVAHVRQCYGLPEDYALYVGRIDRVKNLSSLVRAFEILRRRFAYGGKVVFVGEEYKKNKDTALYPLIRELGLHDLVIFTGPVPDQDLPAIFSGAQVAVLPSLYEGFGIAALEAMASGAPVIVNRAGAVGETVGDAAVVLYRGDEESLANALGLVIGQPALRATMRCMGLERARQFGWDASARQTLDVYRKVLGQ